MTCWMHKHALLLIALSHTCAFSRRIQSQSPDSEMDNYASFISEALEKTKCRECVPSWEEIQMLMNRQEMLCTVHYPGPGSCQLYISSHTTANEVWEHSSPFSLAVQLFPVFQLLSQVPLKKSDSVWRLITAITVKLKARGPNPGRAFILSGRRWPRTFLRKLQWDLLFDSDLKVE